MLLVFEDIGLIVNLGSPSPWCFVEKQDVVNEDVGRTSYLIVFAFPGNMGRPIAFPDQASRDRQFETIKDTLMHENGRVPVSGIVPVGIRPTQLVGVERR